MGLKPRRSTTALYCWCNAVYLGSWDDNQVLDTNIFLEYRSSLAGRHKPKVCGANIRPKNSLRVEAVAKLQQWEEAET
jgi:hypothetical protein